MGSEEDIARALSTVNARVDPPLTQERVVQTMLRSQPTRRAPTGLPVERWMLWGQFALVGLLSVPFLLTFLGTISLAPLLLSGLALTMALSSIPLSALQFRIAQRHARSLLAPQHGFVCLRCHYPLTSLPDEGQCPECGTLYTREQTVRAWKEAYKLKNDWPTRSSISASSEKAATDGTDVHG